MTEKDKNAEKDQTSNSETKLNESDNHIGNGMINNDNPEKINTMLDRIESFLETHFNVFLLISLGLALLFSIILFDSRIGFAGDDAGYIMRASDFIKSFKYPGSQGALYPIVLSPFVLIFGLNVIALKSISIVFILCFLWLFAKAFYKQIPALLLSLILIILSVNSYLLFFSYQTYSEALYLFIQAIFFLVFFKFFIKPEKELSKKQYYQGHILLAVCLLCLGLTKNIGFLGFVVVLIYFISQRQWKKLLHVVVFFLALFLIFQGLKYILWNESPLKLTSQNAGFLYKDSYNLGHGREDFSGFVQRLLVNSNYYISRSFVATLGFFTKSVSAQNGNIIATLCLSFLFLTGIVIAFKRNKFLFFTGIYIFILLIASFIALQTFWMQLRYIIPFYPLMLLFLLTTLYYIFDYAKKSEFRILFFIIPVVLISATVRKTIEQINISSEIKDLNIGITPEGKNYIAASKWVSQSIPETFVVACRKPTVSFVYGNGRHFFGILNIPSYPIKPFIENWISNKQNYVVIKFSDFDKNKREFLTNTALTDRLAAYVYHEKSQLFIYQEPDSNKEMFYNEIKKVAAHFIVNVDSFKNMLSDQAILFYPDSLLKNLCRNHVEYIIVPPNIKITPGTNKLNVSTIYRYTLYINLKYPKLFSEITKFGDKETVRLVRVNYEKYNMADCLNSK
jgi:hypothetical protein